MEVRIEDAINVLRNHAVAENSVVPPGLVPGQVPTAMPIHMMPPQHSNGMMPAGPGGPTGSGYMGGGMHLPIVPSDSNMVSPRQWLMLLILVFMQWYCFQTVSQYHIIYLVF